jgi:hypothetical protein
VFRAPLATIVLLISLTGLAACGSGEKATPAACLKPAPAYLAALRATPGKVELSPGTPISSCLTENQGSGELTTVGTSMVGAATDLNAAARANPAGPAAARLGYLVGAAGKGASGTGGIHSNLIERLRAAALYSPGGRPLPSHFKGAYTSGYAEGRKNG